MNEQNETYGAKLTLLTSEFKNKLKEISNLVKNFGKEAKEETNIMPKMNNTGYEKQIAFVKSQLKDIEKQKNNAFKITVVNPSDERKLENYKKTIETIEDELKEQHEINVKMGIDDSKSKIIETLNQDKQKYIEAINKIPIKKEIDVRLLEELEAKYEILGNKLNQLIKKQKDYNDELEDTEEEGKKTTSSLGNLFDKSIAKIKRFSFYLLGARSVFSMFMKYQNIYYQYNEKMQYQSELSQNAIALSLAPAFEFLGNMVAYASIGFAKFIELLTGVNVLSKVSTKGIRDYNKSLKETQTLVSGIDEVTNLTMPSGTGLASQYQALDDFQKKVKEVEKFFDENKWIKGIADVLKTVWDWLTDTYNFINEHWDVFKYILGGIAISAITIGIGTKLVGVGEAIGTVGTLFGLSGTAGTGLLGIAGILKFLAGLGVISLVISLAIPGIKSDLKEISEKGFKQFITDSLNKALKEELPKIFKTAYELTIKSWLNPAVAKFKEDLRPIWQPIVEEFGPALDLIKQQWDEFLKPKIFDPISEKFNETKNKLLERFTPFLNEMIRLYNLSLGKVFGELDYLNTNSMNEIGKLTEEQRNNLELVGASAITKLDEIKAKENETFKDKTVNVKYDITANTTKATNSLNSLFKKFGLSGGGIISATTGSVAGMLSSFLKNQHAQGLDYVPYDEYPALLHKGEAVVPAKYNPTIHSEGNDYTNSLLETVIVKLDDLKNRPNVFEVDGQKFASATYPLYEEQRSRQNYVEGVVVR